MSDFSTNLKRLRTNNHMSQAALARKMDMTQANISSWETGRTEPSMGDITKLSRVLNCSVSELTGLVVTSNNFSGRTHSFALPPYDLIAKESDKLSSKELFNLIELFKIKAEHKKQIEELESEILKQKEEYQKNIDQFLTDNNGK